jgi:site-specific recombinase XerD
MVKSMKYVSWAHSFNASKRWLTAVKSDRTGSKYTENNYAASLYKFCAWANKNPDQLITERKQELKDPETEMKAEDKLREYCVYLEAQGKRRSTVATVAHAPIKSFYAYLNVPLKLRTPKFAVQPSTPHTTEEIKNLIQIGDVRERAIIMLLKDSGISREDIVKLRLEHIQTEYEQNKEIIHIRLTRQKEAIGYDTFIGKEAIEYLRVYLKYRAQRGEKITKDTPLIATPDGRPLSSPTLSAIFLRLSAKAGFQTSPHKFRKFFESHLAIDAPSIMVKYWMGHNLGVEKSYFLPEIETQRTKYGECYKQIEIFKTEISEIEKQKQICRVSYRMSHLDATTEQIQAFENMLASVRSEEELDKGIRNIMGYVREKESKCENDNCQKIIGEEELQDYLTKGWRFVATLTSGKIVVTNE